MGGVGKPMKFNPVKVHRNVGATGLPFTRQLYEATVLATFTRYAPLPVSRCNAEEGPSNRVQVDHWVPALVGICGESMNWPVVKAGCQYQIS